MSQALNRWLIGYVVLRLRGKYVERFINAALRVGIEMWDIYKQTDQDYQLKVRLQHFFLLHPILRETGTKLRIERKVGFPFYLQKIKLRKGIIIGLFIFILTVYMLSTLIWQVEVNRDTNIPRSEIDHVAKELGLRVGMFRWRLPPLEQIQGEFLKRLDGASWVGIKFDGVIVRIQVVDQVRPDEEEHINPRHLVAKKKAVIYDIFVEKGLAKVTPNQFVNKGDLLISGIIGPAENQERQQIVSAKGKVWGEVWYDSVITVPLEQELKRLTGESTTNYYLILGKYGIKMWGSGSKGSFSEFKQDEEREFLYLRNYRLPIGWKKEQKWEVESAPLTISQEALVEKALTLARNDLLLKTGKDSLIKEEKVLQQWEENGKVYIKVHYAIIEEISEELLIIGSP